MHKANRQATKLERRKLKKRGEGEEQNNSSKKKMYTHIN